VLTGSTRSSFSPVTPAISRARPIHVVAPRMGDDSQDLHQQSSRDEPAVVCEPSGLHQSLVRACDL